MVIFCVCLRWERFIERYTITYLALFCPMIALLINILYETGKERYGDMIIGMLIFVSLSELAHMIPYHYSESTWGGIEVLNIFIIGKRRNMGHMKKLLYI